MGSCMIEEKDALSLRAWRIFLRRFKKEGG